MRNELASMVGMTLVSLVMIYGPVAIAGETYGNALVLGGGGPVGEAWGVGGNRGPGGQGRLSIADGPDYRNLRGRGGGRAARDGHDARAVDSTSAHPIRRRAAGANAETSSAS